MFLSSGIAEFHDIFGRQVAFDINHGSLALTRVTEEDEAVVTIAQGCHHVIAAHHLAILHHFSDFLCSLAVGLQIMGYFRGMVLIYQALVYLEPVTFELRILHRNHLASLGVPESLEYAFYVQPLLGISRNRGYHDKKQYDKEAFYQVASLDRKSVV